jgi:hypothetical protein
LGWLVKVKASEKERTYVAGAAGDTGRLVDGTGPTAGAGGVARTVCLTVDGSV